MKYLIKKILKENEEQNKLKFYNYILPKLKPPYLKNINKLIKQNVLSEEEIEPILSLVFKQPIWLDFLFYNYPEDFWRTTGVYNINNKKIYEESNHWWWKIELNEMDEEIYYEDSDGYWRKSEYDKNGSLIYTEDSNGYWIKYENDEMGKRIYQKHSDGREFEYDNKGVMREII